MTSGRLIVPPWSISPWFMQPLRNAREVATLPSSAREGVGLVARGFDMKIFHLHCCRAPISVEI